MTKKISFIAYLCFVALSLSLFTNGYCHDGKGFDARQPVCLKAYPVDPNLFNDTVAPYVKKIIDRHGIEEWKATLLTNEMHRHLGLWSIIGAKMGIRARQLLNAPFDHLQVVTIAGFNPPFSCLIDGIQISTGASLGRGKISNNPIGQPEALFIYNNKKLMMKPKAEIISTVKQTIIKLSKAHGFQSPEYFNELEKVSVKYWLAWDRSEIFHETVLY